MKRILLLCLIFIIIVGCSSKTPNQPFDPIKVSKEKPSHEQSIENIYAFSKLYGYVRYFHPSSEGEEMNWDQFILYGLQEVIDASNTKQLEEKLFNLFSPIAPTLKISDNYEELKESVVLKTEESDDYQLVAWKHNGVSGSNKEAKFLYNSERILSTNSNSINILGHSVKSDEYILEPINNSLFVKLPIVLYVKDDITVGTTDVSRKNFNKLLLEFESHTNKDRVIGNVADIVVAWNVFQHFYPYFHTIDINWELELNKAIKAILSNEDFNVTLDKMLAELRDGHIKTVDKSVLSYLPFSVDYINNQIVVTNVKENSPIKIGDTILSIDGVNSVEKLNQLEGEISGSPQLKRYRALQYILSNTLSSSVIEVKRGNKLIKETINYSEYYPLYEQSIYETGSEVDSNIFYINLVEGKMSEFLSSLEKLRNAKGVIFDLRGYPTTDIFEVIQYLIEIPVDSPPMKVPVNIYPDHKEIIGYKSEWGWSLTPKEPKLQGKVAFLTNAGAISTPETFMGIVDHYNLGKIIGQPTAGANGNINNIQLPGSKKVITWTGLEVTKHDGSQLHIVGIQPDITVERSIEAVLEGRDEYIEKAIQWINQEN
ncbi:S41 family peptidase [Bacillus sp. AK128]